MLDCLIIGDSIAVGTHHFRPDCVAYAKGGWNSQQWNKTYLHKDLSANTVIISLGTNDHSGVHTFKELMDLRVNVSASKVFWIMPPIKPNVQDIVRIIATNYKDTIIEIPELSKDKIHPTPQGYKKLGQAAK